MSSGEPIGARLRASLCGRAGPGAERRPPDKGAPKLPFATGSKWPTCVPGAGGLAGDASSAVVRPGPAADGCFCLSGIEQTPIW